MDSSPLNSIGYILVQYGQEDKNRILEKGICTVHIVQCGNWVSKLAWKGYSPIEMEGIGITWAVQEMDFYFTVSN